MTDIITLTPEEKDLYKIVFAIRQLAERTSDSWSNQRISKTAAYTVRNSDSGATFALGGNAFFELTFGTATEYDINFNGIVVNEDEWTGGGRAKRLVFTGGDSMFLWPRQTVVVFVQNGVWRRNPEFQRARLPDSTTVIINTDFTNGSDTSIANDGLTTGAGNALKTVNFALKTVLQNFDFARAGADPPVKILMASGVTDTTAVHSSPHGFVGAQGSNSVRLDMNGSALTGGSQFFFGSILRIRNGKFSKAGDHSLSIYPGAKVYLEDGITLLGATGGGFADIYVEDGGYLSLNGTVTANTITVSGLNLRSYVMFNNGGTIVAPIATSMSFANGQTMTATVFGAFPGKTDLQNVTWATNANTITATNAVSSILNHVVTGSAAVAGTGADNTATGGQAV